MRDQWGGLAGVVSMDDIAVQSDTLAQPFFTFGEIERRLRRGFGKVFELADAKAARCKFK